MLTLNKTAMNTQNFARLAILLLIGLMAGTRIHHFGDSLSLPDASLAVFFLIGFLSKQRWLFALLLVLAGLLDYLAITHFGVSDWCLSPAYLFLIPTYAVMWLAGGFCRRYGFASYRQLAICFGLLTLATATAFGISNASFYLFSGRFSDLPWLNYIAATNQYFPAYVSATLIYVSVLFAAASLFKMLLNSAPGRVSKTA